MIIPIGNIPEIGGILYVVALIIVIGFLIIARIIDEWGR